MSRLTRTPQEYFGQAIGRKLRKVVASVHIWGDDGLNDAPLCLWFFFEALPALRLAGAPDGWSIQADEVCPEPIDLGESGEIILRDISRRSIFCRALERTLEAAWSVQDATTGRVIGLRFDFGQSCRPLVLNWGDELYIGETYPDDAKGNEILEASMQPG